MNYTIKQLRELIEQGDKIGLFSPLRALSDRSDYRKKPYTLLTLDAINQFHAAGIDNLCTNEYDGVVVVCLSVPQVIVLSNHRENHRENHADKNV